MMLWLGIFIMDCLFFVGVGGLPDPAGAVVTATTPHMTGLWEQIASFTDHGCLSHVLVGSQAGCRYGYIFLYRGGPTCDPVRRQSPDFPVRLSTCRNAPIKTCSLRILLLRAWNWTRTLREMQPVRFGKLRNTHVRIMRTYGI